MIPNVLKAVFGSRNDRLLKQYRQTVAKIKRARAVRPDAVGRRAARKDRGIRKRYADGATLDELLPEAFAWSAKRPSAR